MKTNAGLLTSVLLLACTLSSFGQPSITLQPTDQTANQGFSATFKVTATTANPPLKYEWSFASNGIPGATTNVFTLINAQPTNAGGYFVVVSDSSGSVTSRTATLTIVLPAALHSKIGPNIPIGGDSAQLSGKHQTEPHLVRSYTDPNLMIATFQDGIGASFRPGAACSYAVSTDGGLSWSRNFIPGLTTVSGGTNVGAADNVAGFDLQGNAYIASLAGTLNYPSQMVICKSTDGGRTFTAPLGLATATSSNFPDKPWLAINTFAHSLTPNRLAVVFSRGPDGDFNGTPFATVSDDTGLTWSAPKRSAPVLVQGQQAFFLPDGTLADLYWHTLSGGSQRIEMILSSDGGETFAAPIVVLDMTGRDYREPTHYGTTTFASAASDRQAGVLYMAIQALISGSPRILFTKSIDKGRTWSTAVAVNDTPADRSVFTPGLAVSADGQHVTIEFYDKRNQTATSANNFVDVYLAESFDGGDTWEPNLRLSEFSSDIRNTPRLSDGRYWFGDYQSMAPSLNPDTPAVACWIDTRSGNSDPYVVRITRTKGTTFDTWRKLRFSTNDLANVAISGENADPDADGIPNLAEYAFGLEPTHADAGPLKIPGGFSDLSAAVSVSYEWLAVLTDIQFSWLSSTNLLDWTPVSTVQEKIMSGRDPSKQRVEASFTADSRMQFFRLGMKRLPPTS